MLSLVSLFENLLIPALFSFESCHCNKDNYFLHIYPLLNFASYARFCTTTRLFYYCNKYTLPVLFYFFPYAIPLLYQAHMMPNLFPQLWNIYVHSMGSLFHNAYLTLRLNNCVPFNIYTKP